MSIDEDDRTTARVLFTSADAYKAAAHALEDADFSKTLRSEHTIRYLYYHSLELYLKSYLRTEGFGVAELSSNKYGHRLYFMADKSRERGLDLSPDVMASFFHIITSNEVIRSRYPKIAPANWLPLDTLRGLCQTVRDTVGAALQRVPGVDPRL
jgi:hypothetical protein